jgi:hypothetical protein
MAGLTVIFAKIRSLNHRRGAPRAAVGRGVISPPISPTSVSTTLLFPTGVSAQLSAPLRGVRKHARALALSVLVLGSGAPAGSQAPAISWLDAAHVESWNRPGMPIPSALQGQKNPDPRCREFVRAPASEDDRQVRAHGWDLVGPTSESEQVRVIVGTSNYDGMCRPWQYQEFVFVRGIFAGTLSPVPMDSRTDGALGRITIQNDGRVQAEYSRYGAADPLCCPSRITTVVFEIETEPPVLKPVSTSTVSTRSPTGQ